MRRPSLVLAGFLVACSGELPVSNFVSSTATLPAEEYQAEIMEIDQFVFSNEPIGEGGRSALASSLENLAARVDAAKGDSIFLGLQARQLKGFAERVRRIRSAEPVPGSLRNFWMGTRSNIFDDRFWFARSAADLSAPPIVAVRPRKPEPVVAVAPQEPPVAQPAPRPRGSGPKTALEGQWVETSTSMNGRPSFDPELSRSQWIFEGRELFIISAREPGKTIGHYRFEIIRDERGSALRVESQPGSEREERGWMIYELNSDQLRLALFDGLGERPAGFEPESPRQEPELVVVVLARAPS